MNHNGTMYTRTIGASTAKSLEKAPTRQWESLRSADAEQLGGEIGLSIRKRKFSAECLDANIS